MATRFEWDVQPYALVSELTNRYTNVVISTTINKAEARAAEAEEWMFNNAPWRDRSPEMRRKAAEYGAKIGEKGARESLFVRVNVDPNQKRHYEGMRRQALKEDAASLRAENVSRSARGLEPRSQLPKSRSRAASIEREIRVLRGPIVELLFSHGDDVPYAVWLEIARGGRWGIISRAIEHWSGVLLNDIKQIANLSQYNITFGETGASEAEQFAAHVASENRRLAELGETRTYQPFSRERKLAAQPRRKKYLKARREARKWKSSAREVEETISRLEREEAVRRHGKRTTVKFFDPVR